MAYKLAEICMLVNINLKRSECVSWVQAWGSVIAILVAFYIPFRQRKIALEEANIRSKAAATVAASGVLLTINQILACIDFVSENTEMYAGVSGFNPDSQIKKLESLRHPSEFERLALVECAPICATDLAIGARLLSETTAALTKMGEAISNAESIDEEIVEELIDLLNRAKGHYKSALPTLLKIAR